MKLQTDIPLKKQTSDQIDYDSEVLLLGSCFVENISRKLAYFKFRNHQNPFGVLFHPKAIETLVFRALNEKEYADDEIFFHNEQWHCFDAHSQLSDPDKSKLISDLNAGLRFTKEILVQASHIVLTFGTAWVYKYNDVAVANCHKLSQNNFSKTLLSVDEIDVTLQNIYSIIKVRNPKATVIFTVSPIRHLKDGFIENTQSKSHLIAGLHEFLANQKNDCHYFPSYELLMDELRDYRFYTEDMIHPNNTAIAYIWEKFANVWIADSAMETMAEVDAIQKAMAHKPFHPQSQAHLKFLAHLDHQKEVLQKKFGHIQF